MIRGHFLRTVSYLLYVKQPAKNGHLSYGDTYSGILRCPLKIGFTVQYACNIGRFALMYVIIWL